MTWDPTLLEDGDPATASGVNDIMGQAESHLNALDRDSIRGGALGPDHADSLFHRFKPIVIGHEGEHITYSLGVFGTSIQYTTFGADDGTESPGVYTGDRAVLGHPDCPLYTGGRARIAFGGYSPTNGFKIGMDAGDRISSMLIMLNAELVAVDTNSGAVADAAIMVCLQYRLNSSGTWYTIDNSERFVSVYDHRVTDNNDVEDMNFDFPIACLITPSMIDSVGDHLVDELTEVRAMVSFYSTAALPVGCGFTFHQWSMTALPLYTDEVG